MIGRRRSVGICSVWRACPVRWSTTTRSGAYRLSVKNETRSKGFDSRLDNDEGGWITWTTIYIYIYV